MESDHEPIVVHSKTKVQEGSGKGIHKTESWINTWEENNIAEIRENSLGVTRGGSTIRRYN